MSVEEQRAKVLRYKRVYKDLATSYESLQSQVELLNVVEQGIIERVSAAKQLETNVKKIQKAMRRQNLIKKKMVEASRERIAGRKQAKYLKVVQLTDSHEARASIEALKSFLASLGLTTSMMFRSLDIDSRGSILTDDLGSFLTKLANRKGSSSFSEPTVKRITDLLDSHESGYINKVKFFEVFPNQQPQQPSQDSLLLSEFNSAMQKVSIALDMHGVSPSDMFAQIALVNSNFAHKDSFFSWVKEKNSKQLTGQERLAVCCVFNLSSTQFIRKDDLLIRLSKQTPEKESRRSSFSVLGGSDDDESRPKTSIPASHNSMVSFAGSSKLSTSKMSITSLRSSLLKTSIFGGGGDSQKEVQRVMDKLFTAEKPLHIFIERVLATYSHDKQSLTTGDLTQLLDTYFEGSTNASSKEKGLVFRAMDKDGNGTIEMSEFMEFIVHSSTRVRLSVQSFLIMQAKTLEIEGTQTKEFLKDLGLDDELVTRIDMQTFHATFSQALDFDEETANAIFLELDKERTGTIPVKSLEDLIDRFRSPEATRGQFGLEDALDTRVTSKLTELKEFEKALSVSARFTIEQFWDTADANDKGYVSLYELKQVAEKLIPSLSKQTIIRLLMYIDINENGIIEKDEFLIAFKATTSTSKSNSAVNSGRVSLATSRVSASAYPTADKERTRIIDIFKKALKRKGITIIEFFQQVADGSSRLSWLIGLFRLADTDKSGEVSLSELRVALSEVLQLDLSMLVKLMKILDVNGDGSLQYEEFVEVVGEDVFESRSSAAPRIGGLMNFTKEGSGGDAAKDPRCDPDIIQRLEEFGELQPNELRDAFLKFGSLLSARFKSLQPAGRKAGANMNSVYETIFKEFDTDSSASISRGEFLAGLDKLNTTLELTERQKIRLSLAADKNKDDKIDLNEFTEFLTNTVAQISEAERLRKSNTLPKQSKVEAGEQQVKFQVDKAGEKQFQIARMETTLKELIIDMLEAKFIANASEKPSANDLNEARRRVPRILELSKIHSINDGDAKIISAEILLEVLQANVYASLTSLSESDILSIVKDFSKRFPQYVEIIPFSDKDNEQEEGGEGEEYGEGKELEEEEELVEGERQTYQ